MVHEHNWLTPSALWSSNGYRQVEFYRPTLFEFRNDEFMEEFLAAAAAPNPKALQAARLLPPEGNTLNKLFHPLHGCFYLVASSLCCREPGFPDRTVSEADGESAGFVLRKLVAGKEYAWVVGDEDKGWKPLNGTGRTVLDGEERLPVFPVQLPEGRSTYCGYVPASSSQTYGVPPTELAVGGEALNTPIQELGSRFTTPLTRSQGKNLVDDLPDDIAWMTSVYLVVELWEFLQSYLPDVATAIINSPAAPNFSGDKAEEMDDLLAFLKSHPYKGGVSLAEALQAVALHYKELNAPGGGDLAALGFSQADYSLKASADPSNQVLTDLLDKVAAALPEQGPPLQVPKLDISLAVQYVLRFVFERPRCEPAIVEVSQPSQAFTFAPFFDPDAPARPVRIPLPSDVSIAGMRKFKKNVTFIMSDSMRKKMQSITGKENAMLQDDPLSLTEDSGAFAFVCSFSLQIIFMIAFMLLLIFSVVLNIVFWWLAFFKICLPVPKAVLPE
ncbi:MAG: hypothetical protein WCD37_04400 [Chloroflexia bacterium]